MDMSVGTDYVDLFRAEQLQQEADRLTDVREKAAYFTGPLMAVFGPSWPLGVGVALTGGYTDYKDGVKAKAAAALVGYDVNPDGKDKDRDADKKFTYSGLIGTMVRDLIDGHVASAGFVGGVIAASAVRDTAIARVRAEGVTKESSLQVNRINTAIRIGSLSVGMSPLGRTKIGRGIRNVGFGISVGLAGIGYFQTRRQLRSAT